MTDIEYENEAGKIVVKYCEVCIYVRVRVSECMYSLTHLCVCLCISVPEIQR